MRKRTRALMARPPYDRDPDGRAEGDRRSPREWAASDPAAARYRDRKPFTAPVTPEALDAQGRAPRARSWRLSVTEPPLSAAPEGARAEAGLDALSLSDRLAPRARGLGDQTSYTAAVWTGAADGALWKAFCEGENKFLPHGDASEFLVAELEVKAERALAAEYMRAGGPSRGRVALEALHERSTKAAAVPLPDIDMQVGGITPQQTREQSLGET